jgi:hypothetical protein
MDYNIQKYIGTKENNIRIKHEDTTKKEVMNFS